MARAQGPGAPGGVRGSNPSLPSIFAGISGIGLTSLTLAGQHARSRRRCPYCPPCGVRRNYNPFAFPSRLCRLLFGSVAHCIRVMFPPPWGSPSRLGASSLAPLAPGLSARLVPLYTPRTPPQPLPASSCVCWPWSYCAPNPYTGSRPLPALFLRIAAVSG